MKLNQAFSRFRIDPYLLALVVTVIVATVLPARGMEKLMLNHLVDAAIAFLFFLYGARLSTKSLWEGLIHWRLQSLVFATTYIVFPLAGLSIALIGKGHLDESLLRGIIFLCILPSTVQSSIAFTSIAGGNVSAALCSATLSNIIGVVLTPILASMLIMSSGTKLSSSTMQAIAIQILIPFALGQLAKPLLASFLARHKMATMLLDRSSILLIVYSAFSSGVVSGIWQKLSIGEVGLIIFLDCLILFFAVLFTTFVSNLLRFSKEDKITIVFCGSKKSLASGLPIANILFPIHSVGMIVLPLMLFHQAQLFLCAILARNYAMRS
jgi:solute carrier family 10 (sodium/bile acid cotransporter), member 7